MSERLKARQAPEDTSTNRPAQITRLPERVSDADGGDLRRRASISLDTILGRIHRLQPLSPVVVRVLEMTDRDFVSAREIVNVINGDLRFSTRVVKAANAPCLGLPRPVTTVAEAVLLLGTEALRASVVAAAARDALYRSLPGYGMAAQDLWRHSIACAMAAEIIAEMTGYNNRAEAFVAGLLHDVGKIVLDEDMQAAVPLVRGLMNKENCQFLDAERMALGFDHCHTGGRIARTWGVPQHIVQAIALHRKPIVNRQTVPLAGYVHLGEILCSVAGIGPGTEGLDITMETQVLSDFKLPEAWEYEALSRLLDALTASQGLMMLAPTVPEN
jgi:putative nucleotidyltransferase with HDIG domain